MSNFIDIFKSVTFNRAKLTVAPKELKNYQWECLWLKSCGIGEEPDFVELEFQNGDFKITVDEHNLSEIKVLEDKVVLNLNGVLSQFKGQSIELEVLLT